MPLLAKFLRAKLWSRAITMTVITTFSATLCLPLVQAQVVTPTSLSLSPSFSPVVLKGIKVYPANPFRFDFLVDQGQKNFDQNSFKDESNKLIKYFLASLTIPEKDLWVNLSPYEKDRIIPDGLSQTEMGRDLLTEDYILKQLTASLVSPENELGKRFWDEVYSKARQQLGSTDIPVDAFNKIWIVPDHATVYENKDVAFVVESRLKVMLEEDLKGSVRRNTLDERQDVSGLTSDTLRSIVLPAIEREVNEGEHFVQLRQIYQSLILATWYKHRLKESVLSQQYVDQQKVKGVNIDDPKMKEKIYGQYLDALKKGVSNYIKDEYDPLTQQIIPRRYFTGGTRLNVSETTTFTSDSATLGVRDPTPVLKVVATKILNTRKDSPASETVVEMIPSLDPKAMEINVKRINKILAGTPYQAKKYLAKGGMGFIFEGVEIGTRKKVIIKVARPHKEDLFSQFLRNEVIAQNRLLNDSQILRDLIPGLLYIKPSFAVMDFVEGKTLRSYETNAAVDYRLDLTDFLEIAIQISSGLYEMHKMGLVHRDLKGENVILNEKTKEVKLLDFGLVTPIGGIIKGKKRAQGTPLYNPPEFYNRKKYGQQEFHPRQDVYSFGMMLYLMSVPVASFDRHKFKKYTAKKLAGFTADDFKSSSIPVALQDIILKALATDPSERYQSVFEMVQVLVKAFPNYFLGKNSQVHYLKDQPEAFGGEFAKAVEQPLPPDSVILDFTDKIARQIFGQHKEAIGKTLEKHELKQKAVEVQDTLGNIMNPLLQWRDAAFDPALGRDEDRGIILTDVVRYLNGWTSTLEGYGSATEDYLEQYIFYTALRKIDGVTVEDAVAMADEVFKRENLETSLRTRFDEFNRRTALKKLGVGSSSTPVYIGVANLDELNKQLRGTDFIFTSEQPFTQGSYGWVFKGRRTSTGEDVIIKVAKLGEESSLKLEREAFERMMMTQDQKLIHFIPRLFHRAPNYLIMESAKGYSLEAFYETGTFLGTDQIFSIAQQILYFLENINERGWIHGDLGLGNVLWDSLSLRAKVLDFGFFDRVGNLIPKLVPGTLPFIAPEIFLEIQNGRDIKRSPGQEIYSVGVMLYLLLEGKTDFLTNDKTILKKKMEGFRDEDFLKDVPRELKRIVLRALENDPNKRYQSAGEMRDDLSASFTQIKERRDTEPDIHVANPAELRDQAMISNPGGIALNPEEMNLKIEGKSQPWDLPADPAMLNSVQIEGLFPVIIDIRPMTNLPLFLGEAQEPISQPHT